MKLVATVFRRTWVALFRMGRVVAEAIAVGFLLFRGLDLALPLDEARLVLPRPSPIVRSADGTPLRIGLAADGTRALTSPRAPSPHLVNALVAAEDRRFREHMGVDLRSLGRAVVADVARLRAAEGASTITMQLARLVEPSPRTLWGKAVQMFRALQLEEHLSKDEILAAYLARAPFGRMLRGAEAASIAFFGHGASDLEPDEAALLVSVLPAPSRFDPRRDAVGARGRRDRVLERMREEGFLDDASVDLARSKPVRAVSRPFPSVAPHAVARAGAGTTTIERPLQDAIERIAARATGPDGIAIVVVDVATGRVRALTGASTADARLLDATDRPRSAGSTWKPFLYALAFDRGIAAPGTMLLDLPWASPDWSPSNFDRTARGPVSARDALSLSMNLPAVRLAAALEKGEFADLLARLGVRRVRCAADDASIDLAIGTDDVTPLELAGCYATLARGGVVLPTRLLDDGTPVAGRRVLSAGACALVTEILADPARSRPEGAPFTGMAWKTGTSSRRRDAWAAGYTSSTAAVVWRGRLDGAPDPTLVGAEMASPTLVEVLAAADRAPRAFATALDGTVGIEVCAESGLAAGPACKDRRADRVPTDARPLASCGLHLRVELDAATGALVCRHCRARAQTVVARDVALYPPALAAWRARAGLPCADLPPHLASCDAPEEPDAARSVVVSPRPGARIEATGSGAAIVAFRAMASDPASSIEFVLDGISTGKTPSDAALSHAVTIGRHVLTAVTASGRRTTVTFEVETPEAAVGPQRIVR